MQVLLSSSSAMEVDEPATAGPSGTRKTVSRNNPAPADLGPVSLLQMLCFVRGESIWALGTARFASTPVRGLTCAPPTEPNNAPSPCLTMFDQDGAEPASTQPQGAGTAAAQSQQQQQQADANGNAGPNDAGAPDPTTTMSFLGPSGRTLHLGGLRAPGFLDKANFPVSPRSEAAYDAITAEFDRLAALSAAAQQGGGARGGLGPLSLAQQQQQVGPGARVYA